MLSEAELLPEAEGLRERDPDELGLTLDEGDID
jgi:hypothetical protein